jgi:hypothetical protein|tara:strand:- start:265 stop:387 length:123 start_codon:yes stop_codon:yes gene_type:complete
MLISLAWSQGGGYALDFDGSNDFVKINDANILDGLINLTT